MRTFKTLGVMAGVALAVDVALVPEATASLPSGEAAWEIVPDQILSTLRGGLDIPQNNLVAYFAIQRVIEVDGQVVARMQIVISNLDSGAMPSVSISGATADLVQIMNALPVAAPTALVGTGASSAAPAAATAGAAPASAAASPASPVAAATPSVSGTISKSNTQSGSSGQFGSALASAMTVATGATSGGAGTSTASAPSTPTNAPTATAALSAPSSTSTASAAHAASVAAGSQGSTITQVAPASIAPLVVVSNLPNASAITTAVQNDVRAATIQIQTTITATLNSLSMNNSLSLANAIRSQVASAVP